MSCRGHCVHRRSEKLRRLQEAGYKHVPRIQPSRSALRKGTKSVVPLADRAIGNVQQWLIGTYHGVSKDQLKAYLDEFAFRHNRRKRQMAAFPNAPRPRGRPPADRIQANPGSSRPFRKEWAGWAATTDCAQLSRPDKQETSSRLRNKGSDEPKSPQNRQCPNAESTTGILLLAVTSFVSGDEHSTISHTSFFQQRLPDYVDNSKRCGCCCGYKQHLKPCGISFRSGWRMRLGRIPVYSSFHSPSRADLE